MGSSVSIPQITKSLASQFCGPGFSESFYPSDYPLTDSQISKRQRTISDHFIFPGKNFWLREFLQDAEKLPITVIPAKAGVHTSARRKSGTISKIGSRFSPGTLDSCFRRNDDVRPKRTFSAIAKNTAIKSPPTSLFQREATPRGTGGNFYDSRSAKAGR